jgi:hypothetical protein
MNKQGLVIEMVDEGEFSTLIVRHNGDVLVRESDNGEPGDNSFFRDWRWVVGAIEQAYELGLADGKAAI